MGESSMDNFDERSVGPIAKRRSVGRTLCLAGLALAAIAVVVVGWIVALRHSRWFENDLRENASVTDRPEPTAHAPLKKPSPPSSGYVGTAVCSQCHPKVAADYAGHPMANSLFQVSAAPLVEDYQDNTAFSPTPRRTYRVRRNEQGIWHEEIGHGTAIQYSPLQNLPEQNVYQQSVKVDYAMGSGRRGRSYVINRGGWFYMSPISWYSQKKRWDLSPGYEPESHPRFERKVADQCLHCHVGQMAPHKPTVSHFKRYQQPFILEHSIGCERCHGPGKEHVALHESAGQKNDAAPPDQSDPIVNPANLDPIRRDDVCNQCHLQAEFHVLRYGRTNGDFRPGNHLGDIWTVFVKADKSRANQDAVSVSQVQQMRASACFRGSRGKLGCISCHDPHLLPAKEKKHAFYRDRCLKCHQSQGCSLPHAQQQKPPAAGSCIACHMPRFNAADIPHTSQTDHRVLRKISSPAAGPEKAATSPPTSQRKDVNAHLTLHVFDEAHFPLSETERARAQGLVLTQRADQFKDANIAAQAEKLLWISFDAARDDLYVADHLAICRILQGDTSAAIDLWKQILVKEPSNLDALGSLTLVFQQLNDPKQGLVYAERYLAFNDWNAEIHGRYSNLLARTGHLDLAIASARRSQELDPTVAPTYQWLAELYRRNKQMDKAKEQEQRLEKMMGEKTASP